jgi:D-beta-D-heptose 7-phosphate kinase/D-beta-D-heptose 1-phosphate adenosyltransferase
MPLLENFYNQKVLSLDEYISKTKNVNEKIVFTCGCFDVIHIGHLELLLQAKKLGDILIVGINTDESVRKLKSDRNVKRPVHDLRSRCLLLSAFPFVDYLIPFEENDPSILLSAIKPKIFAKGGEYKTEDSIGVGLGTKILDENNIKYVSIPWSYINSSTEILKKLTENEGF